MLIGLYRHKDPLKSMPNERILALAKEALKQNVKLIFFHTKNVNFKKEQILGTFYDGEKWVNKRFPYPTAMINELPRIVSKRTEEENRLRQKIHPTTYLIGNKIDIYNKLSKHNDYKQLVISTKRISSIEDVLSMLKKYSSVVVKPLAGRQGKEIYFISLKNNNKFIVKEDTIEKAFDFQSFKNIFAPKLKEKKYIGQPYIICRTRKDEPYDFRIHVQRRGNGKWGITKTYPRIGSKDSILSNISRGGRTKNIQDFLIDEFKEEYETVLNKLEETAIGVADYIDSFYRFNIDELGIDLAIDDTGHMWLYEVNTGPQTRFHEEERAVHTIAYAKYLTKKHEKPVFNNNSPIVAMLTGMSGHTMLKQACHFVSLANSANFYYFTPYGANQLEESVYGFTYIDGKWVYKELPRPDVIYDRFRMRGFKGYNSLYKKLDSWNVPFSNSLDGGSLSKSIMYEVINRYDDLRQYLIPFQSINNAELAINFIHEHRDVVLKNSTGSYGKSIRRVRQLAENKFEINFRGKSEIITKEKLRDFIKDNLLHTHVMQKYVNSLTKNNQPYDIRIHLVRGKNRELQIAESYARIGSKEGLVSNISSGGYLRKLTDFLMEEFTVTEGEVLKSNINKLLRRLIHLLEEEYGLKVPEVGVDIGVSSPEDLWLFEYNINRPDTIMHEYEVANLMIPYLLTKINRE